MLLFTVSCASQPKAPPAKADQCAPAIDQAVENGDWNKALIDHERLLSQSPDNCLAVYHLGYIQGQLGQRAEEIRSYERAIACGYDKDDLLYFNMGMAKADLGDLVGALKAFETAAAIDPANPDVQFGMGLILLAAGRGADAENAWLHALDLDPQHIESHLALARLYLDQSRWSEAGVHLDAVQAADPENNEAKDLLELLRARRALEYRR